MAYITPEQQLKNHLDRPVSSKSAWAALLASAIVWALSLLSLVIGAGLAALYGGFKGFGGNASLTPEETAGMSTAAGWLLSGFAGASLFFLLAICLVVSALRKRNHRSAYRAWLWSIGAVLVSLAVLFVLLLATAN